MDGLVARLNPGVPMSAQFLASPSSQKATNQRWSWSPVPTHHCIWRTVRIHMFSLLLLPAEQNILPFSFLTINLSVWVGYLFIIIIILLFIYTYCTVLASTFAIVCF